MKLLLITATLCLFYSCASKKLELISPSQKNQIKYDFVIKYPNLQGTAKSTAQNIRREYLNEAMKSILVAIYRTGDFGNLDYTSLKDIQFAPVPFSFKQSSPLSLNYKELHNYGEVYAKIYNEKPIYKNRNVSSWRGQVLKPIAYDENDKALTAPKTLRSLIESKFILLTKSQLKRAITNFTQNYQVVGGEQLFNDFLKKIAFYKIANKAPETNPSIYEIFKSYKSVSPSRYGVAKEEVNEVNALNFVLNKYKHYPYNPSTAFSLNYDPNKFLWGLIFVLNSEIDVKRVNKKTLKVRVNIPIRKILKSYNIKKISDYIE